MFSIYYLHDGITNKRYVGQTEGSLEKRFKRHIYDAKIFRNNKTKCDWINSSSNIQINLIEQVSSLQQADNSERFWIKKFKDEGCEMMNGNEGGRGWHPFIQTPESLLKMSINRKGKCAGKEHYFYGKHHTEESKRKISQGNIGKIKSEEFKKKCSKRKNNTKLNWNIVNEIRNKYVPYKYTTKRLSEEYGMSQVAIKELVRFKTWKVGE